MSGLPPLLRNPHVLSSVDFVAFRIFWGLRRDEIYPPRLSVLQSTHCWYTWGCVSPLAPEAASAASI